MKRQKKQDSRKSHKKSHSSCSEKTLTGSFSSSQAGFGFVKTADSNEIFIPPKYVKDAINGDTVEVKLVQEDYDREGRDPIGKVVSILQRGRQFIVAELESSHEARPMDKRLPSSIPVNSVPKGVKKGQWVKLRLLNDGKKHTEKLRGTVEESFGKAGTVDADIEAIVAEYNLMPQYSDEQNVEAEHLVPATIDRTDLTDLFCVTIDPEDAKDFDDAISLSPAKKRTEIQLGVHIADVAAWIRPGSKFDKEAEKRAFSSYIPCRFSPMLPKMLTAKISLKEGICSPAHTILFTIRKADGAILSATRCHSWINVTKRLTFPQISRYIENKRSAPKDWTPEFKKNLTKLIELTREMRAKRKQIDEFLVLDTSEVRVRCNEVTHAVESIERRVQGEADQLVEECMLVANSAVAEELIRKQIPGLFRIHNEPLPEKMDDFTAFLEGAFQIHPGDLYASRTACNRFLESLPDDQKKPIILSKFLCALPRAIYQNEPALHYGLGKLQYSHFTSPIRRYPDLIVHQQLWSADTNARLKNKKTLADIAADCSAKEENSDNAYFAANDRMKIHYLKDHGAIEDATMYEAVISKVSPAGLVCNVPDLGLYGFVPTSNLRGGQFHRTRSKQKMSANLSHTQYKIGDFIYLVLDSIDIVRGTAIFRPAV